MVPAPAATAASVDGSYGQKAAGITSGEGSTANTPTVVNGNLTAPIDTAKQIVKTGQMTLEVNDLDAAASQAQSTIAGLGGSVDQSDQSGSGDYATASIVFRVPVDKWDSAIAALRKIGNKVVSQSTSSSDVTSQVVDLAARIDNLTTTEHALQAIMARASAIPDVIAVEAQLSDTQGQIEELTAQSNLLKNQAAMSTLSVVFQLPAKTVTTQATQDWTIGGQIDQAGAALVRIGQGLATIGVWILVVVLPIGFGILVLFGMVAIARRILGRAGRRATAGA
jgi:Ca-activated chloride channel homolog